MSYIILLYLFCLTSVADDVTSRTDVLSIWQCYGGSGKCGSLPEGPLMLNDTSIRAEDLPSENEFVSLDSLIAKLFVQEPNTSYGLVILEAGNTSYVEWWLSSAQSQATMTSSQETNPPLVQEAFVRDLPIYHFSASLYDGVPSEVIMVAPGASLAFLKKEHFNYSACYHSALVAAPVKWTGEVAQVFVNPINIVQVKDCEICTHLPVSSEFIRICPQLQFSKSSSNHSQLFPVPTEGVIALVEPTLWDTNIQNQSFTVTLNSSRDLPTVETIICIMESEGGSQHPLKTENITKNTVQLTAFGELSPSSYSLSCLLSFINQKRTINSTYSQKLIGMNYTALIETENGLVVLPCHGNSVVVTAKFKIELSPVFSNVYNVSSYCFIDKATYPGRISGLTMQCKLDNPTLNHDMDAYFVRSAHLHNATMTKQIPIRLQRTCETMEPAKPHLNSSFVLPPTKDTDMSVELSHDLQGIVISRGSENTFPVGLISCERVIGNYHSLGASTELTELFEAATERSVSFPTKLLDSEASAAVTACNFANMCTIRREIILRPVMASATLSVTMAGVEQSLVPSMAIRLRALPGFSRCNERFSIVPDDAQYNWAVRGEHVTSDDTYRIPAFTYKVGDSVAILVEVYYKDTNTNQHLRAIARERLTYVAENLIVVVDAISRSVASDAPVVIDASHSKNPNDRESVVTHQWECKNLTSGSECQLPQAIDLHSAVLRIPPKILDQGMTFNFTDTVSAKNLSGTVWSVVTVGPPRLPQIYFIPFSQDKVSTKDHARIQAYVAIRQGWLNTSWEVIRTPHTSYFNLSTFLENPNATFTQEQLSNSGQAAVSLTIPPANPNLYPDWTGLVPGMQYNIRLNAYTIDGSAHADVQIVVNAPPSIGLVEVVPPSGAVALNTQVEFRMGDGWSDEDLPLQYRFGIKVLFVDNTSQVYWFPRTGASSHRLYLPAALSKEPACGKFTGFQGVLEVCDLFHSCSMAESAPFEVSQPPNVTIAIVDMFSAISSYIGNGNVFAALSSMHVIDVQRCAKNFDMVTADKIATKLLMTLDNNSDTEDYKEVLYSTSRIMNDLSPSVLEGIILLLEHYRSILGMTSSSTFSSRTKREVAPSIMTNEQEADDMLSMYDLLLEKNQQIVDVYLLNIQDFLSTFCIQLDETTSRIMSAKGNGYTTIQAQSLVPGAQNFSSSAYSIAGEVGQM
ncbi:REJ domain-containing protein, partial [Trichostrongylus colubriformis]